jgi:acyl-CoA thioester hydrolase
MTARSGLFATQPSRQADAGAGDDLPSCEIQIRVRYPECDPMGVLHHARFFEYFEMGRIELLRRTGVTYRECEERGYVFAVTKVACQYHAPARFDDVLSLVTRIERMTRARIDHSYRLMRDGVLICEATTTVACLDRTGRPQLIPDFVRVGQHD